jgi:hypothetical protein
MESRRGAVRAVLGTVLGASLLAQFSNALAAAGKARGAEKFGNLLTPATIRTQAECSSISDCAAPQGGTATCFEGSCVNICTNPRHRICGSDPDVSDPGVCQECCNDTQCRNLAICQDVKCQCLGEMTVCDAECVDTNIEPYHCGRCGIRCPSGTCVNGQCEAPESCGLVCNPQQDPDCEPVECPGNKVCHENECVCPPGMVDCDGDGVCEACGRCDVTECPPTGGAAGVCCPDGRCSCGGECCDSGKECFWLEDLSRPDILDIETCEPCDGCAPECCQFCHIADCQWNVATPTPSVIVPIATEDPAGPGKTIRHLRHY